MSQTQKINEDQLICELDSIKSSFLLEIVELIEGSVGLDTFIEYVQEVRSAEL